MSTFLKYLLSLAFHTMWMRAGKSGPIPPVRLPRGKGTVPIPAIGPWQMLLISWVMKKLWQRYGDDVRAHVGKVAHPAAQKIHDWMPSTNPKAGTRKSSGPPATFVVPGVPATAPAGAGAAAASPSVQTQRLPDQSPVTTPSGSLLSRLRKGA